MKARKMENYYKELPAGYKEDYRIDAKKSSVIVLLNVFSFLLILIVGVATYLLRFGTSPLYEEEADDVIVVIAILTIILGYFAYLVVHELTHGISYKLLTKQKLKFGLTLYVAYCGLREGYVNKKTALIAILAPFVVHTLWMVPTIFLVREPLIALAFVGLFALHFGGCVGDLWGTCILLFKYAGEPVLMSDSGPCQIFYTYSDDPALVIPTEAQDDAEPTETDEDKPEAEPEEIKDGE